MMTAADYSRVMKTDMERIPFLFALVFALVWTVAILVARAI